MAHRIDFKPLSRLAAVLALGAAAIGAMSVTAKAQSTGNFQGVYGGIHAGGAFGKAQAANTSGFVAGVQAGANAQFQNNVVVGVEGDVSASSISHKGFQDKFRQGAVGTVRARGGYAFDRVLVYGTGGLAVSSSEWKNPVATTSKTLSGWAYGVGAEFLMTPNVTVRGEFLRYDYGKETYLSQIGPVGVKPSNNVLRAGTNLKF